MKKLLITFGFALLISDLSAQFFNGLGITIGGTAANQKFFYKEPSFVTKKKYLPGFNGSVMAEFTSYDYIRWVSEFQFNQKGAKDPRDTGEYRNRLQYLSWNNYLKIRYELFSCIPYVLIGPRLEYTLTETIGSPDVIAAFQPLHLSLAIGAGAELVSFTKWKLFAEAFYVPDMMPAYTTSSLDIKNNDFELRLGLKYNFHDDRETCNTPVYVE